MPRHKKDYQAQFFKLQDTTMKSTNTVFICFFFSKKIRVVNAFRHGMDSQHLQQATSNPNIQRVLQKQVSLSNKRMSVASSSYNTEAASAVQHQMEHQQPQSLPPQLQHPQPPPQTQMSFPPKQQPGMHVAPPGAPPIPPYGLQTAAGSATTRISIPEQSSYSHTETAV